MIIRILLIIPYAIFKRIIEPPLISIYSNKIYPFYAEYILGTPLIGSIAKFFVGKATILLDWMTHILDFMSGKMSSENKKEHIIEKIEDP